MKYLTAILLLILLTPLVAQEVPPRIIYGPLPGPTLIYAIELPFFLPYVVIAPDIGGTLEWELLGGETVSLEWSETDQGWVGQNAAGDAVLVQWWSDDTVDETVAPPGTTGTTTKKGWLRS